MKFKTIVVAALVGLLAVSGCKKEANKSVPATGSGSADMTASGSGMAADPVAVDKTGSNSMTGSADMGSGAAMTGSGESMTGSAGSMVAPPDTGPGANLSDAEIEGIIKELLAMFKDMTKAASAGKDCAASAAGINKVLDANQKFLDRMKTLSKDTALETRAKKIMEDKGYNKQMETASKDLSPIMQKCATDEAMGKAMQRMAAEMQ